MSTPKAVSDFMRDMQARSAKSRWAGMTAAEKSAAMKSLRAKAQTQARRPALERQGQRREPAADEARKTKNLTGCFPLAGSTCSASGRK